MNDHIMPPTHAPGPADDRIAHIMQRLGKPLTGSATPAAPVVGTVSATAPGTRTPVASDAIVTPSAPAQAGWSASTPNDRLRGAQNEERRQMRGGILSSLRGVTQRINRFARTYGISRSDRASIAERLDSLQQLLEREEKNHE